jgi:hypothetical protein
MTVFLYIVTVIGIAAIYPLSMWIMMRGAHRGPHHDPEQHFETVPPSRSTLSGR